MCLYPKLRITNLLPCKDAPVPDVASVLPCRILPQDADQSTPRHCVTVRKAAAILRISPEAVRARINRGTLKKDKYEDGTVYVRLDVDQSQGDGRWDGRPTLDSDTLRKRGRVLASRTGAQGHLLAMV